jgi:hypothetical protein
LTYRDYAERERIPARTAGLLRQENALIVPAAFSLV